MNLEILVTNGPGIILHHEIYPHGIAKVVPHYLSVMSADRVVMIAKTFEKPELRHGSNE